MRRSARIPLSICSTIAHKEAQEVLHEDTPSASAAPSLHTQGAQEALHEDPPRDLQRQCSTPTAGQAPSRSAAPGL